MAEPAVLLWDVGGVLLSNGFDEGSRAEASRRFGLDAEDLERRYHAAVDPYERGETSLDEFLTATVFHTERPFGREEFRRFVLGCSTPHPETIAIARAAARRAGRLTACFNNEGRELNDYRLGHFGLVPLFALFFSSCATGRRKPEPGAYRLVLDVLGREPGTILFIDDRPENLGPAEALGMRTIHYRTPAELRRDLGAAGVDA